MADAAVRIAVLGAGGWGSNHVRTWHRLGALAVVCDADADRRAAVRSAYADVEVTPDPSEVFRRDDIRGVVLATPAPTHAELALAAIGAGKDVLVEKPLAVDLAGGTRVVEAAEAAGAVLMVGHVLVYHPAVRRLHQLVVSGELGPLRWASSSRLNLGRVRSVENVLWSFAPHDIALLLQLVGDDPVQVTCRGGAYLSKAVEDVVFLGLDFPGGVTAQVSASWLHPFKEHRLVVVGERAMAVLDDTAPPGEKLTVRCYQVAEIGGPAPTASAETPIAVPVDEEASLEAECRHFLDRILDRRRPLTDGRSGLRVLRVLEAGQRSLDLGGMPVHLAHDSATGGGARAWAHPTATVDDGATVGAGTRIWHYSHVMSGAVIGEDCTLGQNVFVADGVRIGDRVKIQNNVSVYRGVVLEDGVFCGPSMVFTNVMNPRSEVERKDEYRSTLVRRGATLGANSTVVCGITIGEFALVGAGTVVTRDVPPHALVTGVPGRVTGFVCRCGEKLPNDLVCGRCGARYERSPDGAD